VTALDAQPSLLVRVTPRLLSAVREVTLLGSVFLLYELGRHVVRHRAGLAFGDAASVLSVEEMLPLPSETWLQGLMLHSEGLTRAANVFYVSVHFPATIAFLVWMWVARPRAYTWARSVLVSVTMVALLLHVTFPLAPPRMLPGEGFVDTMEVYGPSAYGAGTESVTNQYAAMPSLHAAWALFVGFALVAVLTRRWRWAALLHPLLTVLVVVATGNHYWLDVIAAAALVVLAMLVHGFAPASAGPVSAPRQRVATGC
jgi:PAP2 superfamily